MKVLVVEDEKRILDFVRKGFEESGFSGDYCANGDDGYILAKTREYDVLILDIMLPGRDGLSILKNIREKGISTPVILLTARSELQERLDGLNSGADDYLTKPFFVEELIARVHSLMRRGDRQSSNLLEVGSLKLNRYTREVYVDGETTNLSTREFNLLEYFMRFPERVFSRTQLLEHVWDYNYDPNTNLIDVCIQRLRKKIDEGRESSYIESVRGVGYRFKKLD